MKIVPMIPFALDMNLGRAYNEAMALLPDDGWACFLDHDAMWTTRSWYRQVSEAVAFRPEAGFFTATTNRIFSDWQRVGDPDCHDIARHRAFGAERASSVRTLLDVTEKLAGGVVLVVSKLAWKEAGGFVDGLLCVDHRFHAAVRERGRKVWLIEGLYVYHWRRANMDHLPRGVQRAACDHPQSAAPPTIRVNLP